MLKVRFRNILLGFSFFYFLGESNLASAFVINILADSDRGGFGDVASNLLMAQNMAYLYPNWKIRLIATEVTAEHLKVLVPNYERTEVLQQHGNIWLTYASTESAILPAADFLIEFSAITPKTRRDRENRQNLLQKSHIKTYFVFHEYTTHQNELVSHVPPSQEQNFSQWEFFTGVGSTGLYVIPEAPPPEVSRKTLFDRLKQIAPLEMNTLTPDNTLLGFAYTSTWVSQDGYLSAATDASDRLPQGKKLLLVINGDFDPSPAPNVQYLTLKKLPFELTKSIIAHADRPVLVTGDVSLSLAIQYGKPFFYEALFHKEAFIKTVVDQIHSLEPKLAKSGWPLLAEGGLCSQRGWPPLAYNEGRQGYKKAIDFLADENFTDAFPEIAQTFRSRFSLPERMAGYLEAAIKTLAPRSPIDALSGKCADVF